MILNNSLIAESNKIALTTASSSLYDLAFCKHIPISNRVSLIAFGSAIMK